MSEETKKQDSVETEVTTSNEAPSEATTVVAANESRFVQSHFSEPLTQYSTGWKDKQGVKDLVDYIAPTVFVDRRFEFKKAQNAEAFLSEADDLRAIGGSFKRVEYNGLSVNEKTLNKGLTIRMDHDEIGSEDWKEKYVDLLLNRIFRNELKRTVEALESAVGEDVKNQVWNNSQNPDAQLREIIASASKLSGIRPNRILFGEKAWNARATAYENKDNATALRLADLSPKELAAKLLVDDVQVARSRFQSGSEKSAFIDNAIYVFYAQDEVTKDEPSNLKRFVTKGQSGQAYNVYFEEHAKYTDISVEMYSNVVVTSNLGVMKIVIEG